MIRVADVKNALTSRIRSTRGNGHYCITKAEEYHIDEMSDTVCHNGYIGVFGEGTRLAMPKTRLRAGLVVIEAWFRGY